MKHTQTAVHKKKSSRYDASADHQQLLTDVHVPRNQFFEEMTEAFVAAGIPWSKVNNSKLRDFLKKHTNQKIPEESTLRKNYLKGLYSKVIYTNTIVKIS